jgi:hypothetical protein
MLKTSQNAALDEVHCAQMLILTLKGIGKVGRGLHKVLATNSYGHNRVLGRKMYHVHFRGESASPVNHSEKDEHDNAMR